MPTGDSLQISLQISTRLVHHLISTQLPAFCVSLGFSLFCIIFNIFSLYLVVYLLFLMDDVCFVEKDLPCWRVRRLEDAQVWIWFLSDRGSKYWVCQQAKSCIPGASWGQGNKDQERSTNHGDCLCQNKSSFSCIMSCAVVLLELTLDFGPRSLCHFPGIVSFLDTKILLMSSVENLPIHVGFLLLQEELTD